MQIRMKHALLFIAAVASVGAVAFTVSHTRVEASQPPASAAAPRAAVALVKRAPVSNKLTVAGEFLPYQEVELHAKVSGYIRKINVDIGDHVRAGQVLAVLEVPELNAQVAGADASVRHSQDEILRARHEVSRAEAADAARPIQKADTVAEMGPVFSELRGAGANQ